MHCRICSHVVLTVMTTRLEKYNQCIDLPHREQTLLYLINQNIEHFLLLIIGRNFLLLFPHCIKYLCGQKRALSAMKRLKQKYFYRVECMISHFFTDHPILSTRLL